MNNHVRSSCTSILIGKEVAINGHVMIGRNEDSKTAWPKHLQFHAAGKGPRQFKSKDNNFMIDLPAQAAAYSATPEWTDKYGVFEEDGINEYQVAMSATESAYANERVLAVDPFDDKNGILEEAMVTVVLPYIKSAREGVQRLGKIVEEHGAAEADGILFADPDEAWYLEIGSGHEWVAQRIPDDSYAVVANQLSIQVIDFNSDDFMFAANLPAFIKENNLWPAGKPLNWREAFGTHDDSDLHYNTPRVWSGQRLLTPSIKQEPQSFNLSFIQKPDRPLSAQDAQTVLSDHYNNTQYDRTQKRNSDQPGFRPIAVATTQESHLLEMAPDNPIHWLAMGISAQSVYVPFYPWGSKVPTAYKYGKETYTSNSAYWVFKLASVLVDRDWSKYGADLASTQTETKQKLGQIRAEYDHKLSQATNKTAVYDEANQKLAAAALDNYRQLIAKLITKQTADSPLSFKVDPNL
ncbi:MAG: C69 family dipeptidase [Lactobacillus sp.]|jgi:dipeptidase|nr:C69 family dipeptidase [Lactobacillus sp.]